MSAKPAGFPPGWLTARSALALVAIVLTMHSGRLAYASWLGSQGANPSLQRAVEIWPRHGGLHRALAGADPRHEKEHLLNAVAYRPHSADALVALSLISESEGDEARADHWLDRAARTDRGFRTLWARLNRMARRGDAAFWATAQHAFQMSHRDRQALLELCWEVRPDGEFLVREVAGRRPPVLFDVTGFLMKQGDLAAARSAFQRLLEQPYLSMAETNAGRIATAEERNQLGLDLCDLHLDRANTTGAWQVWKSLEENKLGNWEVARGFAWRREAGELKGIEIAPAGKSRQLSFSGEQPDEVGVLWRYLPPLPPGRYRMAVDVSPEGALTVPAEVLVDAAGAPTRVELRYRRKPGTVPLRGAVLVGELRWEKQI